MQVRFVCKYKKASAAPTYLLIERLPLGVDLPHLGKVRLAQHQQLLALQAAAAAGRRGRAGRQEAGGSGAAQQQRARRMLLALLRPAVMQGRPQPEGFAGKQSSGAVCVC